MSKNNFYMRSLAAAMAVVLMFSSVCIKVGAYSTEMASISIEAEMGEVEKPIKIVVTEVEYEPEPIEEAIDVEPEEEVDILVEEEPVEPIEEVIEVEESDMNYYDVPLSKDLQRYIFEICEDRGVDPAMVMAIIDRESKYNASAVGDSGASLGLMQIQPRWHSAPYSDRMERLGCTNLLNPYDNVTVGVDILAELIESGNSIEWVLMCYNGGPGHAYSNINQGTVTEYATTVLYLTENLKGE